MLALEDIAQERLAPGSHHPPPEMHTPPPCYQRGANVAAAPIGLAAMRRGLSKLVQLVLIPLVFLLGPRIAQATIFVKSAMAPMVARADGIALGAVRVITPRWEGRRIVSDVQLEVAEAIKGKLPKTITLVAAGGKIGDVAMKVVGGADFRVGDRSIVFLSTQGGVHRLLGLAAGKLDIYTRDNRELVTWRNEDTVEELPLRRVLDELRALAKAKAP
jgi:hypothetical protein